MKIIVQFFQQSSLYLEDFYNSRTLVFKGFSVYIAARLVVQCTVPGLFSSECRT